MDIHRITQRLNRLRDVARHIDEHFALRLTLDQLADIARMSRFHFERVFTEYSGETPLARVRRCRLERARLQLCAGETTSVIDLALDSGYGSAEAFTRAFRSAFGSAPSRLQMPIDKTPPAIKIEHLSPLPIQFIPVSGEVDDSMLPFDELRARAMQQDIPRTRRKGWSIHLSGDFERWAGRVELQAALLSDPLQTRIPSLDRGTLPGGNYAVVEIAGGYDTPPREMLAARILAETGWTLQDGPVLRRFENPTFLPASHEKRFLLYLPVHPH